MASPEFKAEQQVTILASLEWGTLALFVVVDPKQPSDNLLFVLRPKEGEDLLLHITREAARAFASTLLTRLSD